MLTTDQRQQALNTLNDWLDDPDGLDDVATEIADFIDVYDSDDTDVLTRWIGIGEELIAAQVVNRVPAHVAWASVFDAFVLTRPDLLDAAFDDIEAQVIDTGGQPILRPVTGAVTAPPGALARLLGAKTTVGPTTMEGWTVRELARVLAYMWLSTGSPDASLPLVDRTIPAVRLLTYARRVDPHDVVEDVPALQDLLRRAIIEADSAGTPETGTFAQDVLRAIDAEDPLTTRALTRRFGQGTIKGAVKAAASVGNRVAWTWDNLPLLAVGAAVLAAVLAGNGHRAGGRRR